MKCALSHGFLSAACLLLCFATVSATFGEELPISKDERTTRHRLETMQLTLDVKNSALSEVVALVCEQARIKCSFEPRLPDAKALNTDTPITLKSNHDVSLDTALQLVLDQLGLTYQVEADGCVLVVPIKPIDEQLVEKIYDVSSLVTPRVMIPFGEGTKQAHDEHEKQLLELIAQTVRPGSWHPLGFGKIESMENVKSVFVISQSEEVHQEINDLIGQLLRLQSCQVMLRAQELTIADDDWKAFSKEHKFPDGDSVLDAKAVSIWETLVKKSASKPRRFISFNGQTIAIAAQQRMKDGKASQTQVTAVIAAKRDELRLHYTTSDNDQQQGDEVRVPIGHSLLVEIKQKAEPTAKVEERHFMLLTPVIVIKPIDPSFVYSISTKPETTRPQSSPDAK